MDSYNKAYNVEKNKIYRAKGRNKKSNFIKKIIMESKLYPFFTDQEEELEIPDEEIEKPKEESSEEEESEEDEDEL